MYCLLKKGVFFCIVIVACIISVSQGGLRADGSDIISEEINNAWKRAGNSFQNKIQELSQIVEDQEEVEAAGVEGVSKFSPDNQNLFIEKLRTLFEDRAKQSPSDIEALKKLLRKAASSDSSVLRVSQQNYINESFLSNINNQNDAPSSKASVIAVSSQDTMPKRQKQDDSNELVSSKLIEKVATTQESGMKIKRLMALASLAEGSKVSSQAKQSFGNVIKDITDKEKLPDDRKKLLLIKQLLTRVQGGNFVDEQTASQAKSKMDEVNSRIRSLKRGRKSSKLTRRLKRRGLRKKVRKLRRGLRKSKNRSTKKSEGVDHNKRVKNIISERKINLIAKFPISNQVKRLTNIIDSAEGGEFQAKEQDAFASALVRLFENKSSLKGEDFSKFKKLLQIAQKTPLLTSDQQKYVSDKMLPEMVK